MASFAVHHRSHRQLTSSVVPAMPPPPPPARRPQGVALIGDFSNWEPHWCEKDEWGVWTLRLPDGEGQRSGRGAKQPWRHSTLQ